MKEFILRQLPPLKEFVFRHFPTLRTHGKLFITILVLLQMGIIGLMLLANKSLHDVYNASIEDNVQLFMENYELRMKTQDCVPPEEEQQENLDIDQKGFIRV